MGWLCCVRANLPPSPGSELLRVHPFFLRRTPLAPIRQRGGRGSGNGVGTWAERSFPAVPGEWELWRAGTAAEPAESADW
ncbi:hypothetical protein GCM10012285_26740 [Streptomyces kronopolitis]|uniref:Uncharacterized protein n=1 Tax=Streptomyces kronopolitis TaxID=1612435 RepID=A0ABQ2JG99_9ACTN|nr:hypothetical protein GCM10012285_26740 [Streptomyces kronopolitis]